MRSIRIIAVLAIVGVSFAVGHGQEKEKKLTLMQRKLVHAQKVLEGIALNDFAEIVTHSNALHDIAKEAAWKALKTPRYEIYSADFQRITENIARQAKGKNLDGAALAYVDLTLTCVKCHQHVREVRISRAGDAAAIGQ